MIATTRERNRLNWLILSISLILWVLMFIDPGGAMTIAHCPVTDSGPSQASFAMLLSMNPLHWLMAGWAMMLIAMMLPTLIPPIHYIYERSFRNRRVKSVLLFLAGYSVIWMIAGVALILFVLLINAFFPNSYLPAAVVAGVALLWQCSPVKQRCLNRGHAHTALNAFGVSADLDVFRFGVAHGVWCVGSCWALMMLPMLVHEWHFAAMLLVTFVMISERLERPKSLSWRLYFPDKLFRIAIAQARIRMP